MKMAEFLGGTPSFRVGVRSGYDAVQPSGQKIEFGEYRTVTLSRPDRVRVESERSDGAKTLVVLTGKEIVLVDLASKVYATAPQPGTLDESIVYFVKDLGMRLPLAALLLNRLPEELQARVRSVDYVEKTSIYGTASYHLAARTDTVDFGFVAIRRANKILSLCEAVLMLPSRRIDQRQTDGFGESTSFVLWQSYA